MNASSIKVRDRTKDAIDKCRQYYYDQHGDINLSVDDTIFLVCKFYLDAIVVSFDDTSEKGKYKLEK